MTNYRQLAACNGGTGPRLCRRPAAALHSSTPQREPNARPLAKRLGLRWQSGSGDTAFARAVRLRIIMKLRPHHPRLSRMAQSTRDTHPAGPRVRAPQQRRPPASAPPYNAFNHPRHLGPRWQPAAPKCSEGGSAATTPLSPAPYASKSPQAPSPAPSVILLASRASASSLTISLSAPSQQSTTA